MPISVVFDPPLPSDSPSTFNTKAFTLLGDLNDWSTQANALPGEVATNLTTLLAAPPAIGSTTPAAGSFTTIGANDTITAYKGIVISSAGTTYAAGAMGYNDANIGMLFRPPRAGALLAYDFRDFAGTASVLKITDAGAVTIPGTLGAGNTTVTNTSASSADLALVSSSRTWALLAPGTSWTGGFKYLSSGYFGIYDSTAAETRLLISTTGAVTIPGSLSLTGSTFGYGIGAGGTVTQATSKSTAVTLNKSSGTITTNNSTLLAGASEVFAVSNSSAGFGDLVLLSVTSVSPNWGDYEVSHQATGSGAFFVNIKNTAAVSRSDAVEIVFALIKGTAS